MHAILFLFLTILSPVVHAQQHLPLTFTIDSLGIVTDNTSNPTILHDGGGGATQNGYHVQVFADSLTTSEGFNLVHNSVAYYGFRNPDDPTDLYTFGMSGNQGATTFTTTPVGPITLNETNLGANFSVWLLGGMTPLQDGVNIVGVFPALNEGTSTNLYSTIVQMEVVNPDSLSPGETPKFTRLGTGRLFYPSEVNYGSFASYAAIDGYLYLAGSDITGIKLARVPAEPGSMADRNQYDYYNNATGVWQPNEPLTLNNPTGNIITWSTVGLAGQQLGANVGDMWYDNYHETTVMIWGDQGIDGNFWFSYAINNNMEGEWSKPVNIWTPPVPAGCDKTTEAWNYQGHAHPGWDTTGKTLLISFASCADYVTFATVTWG